jgi:pyruvate, water dikinase
LFRKIGRLFSRSRTDSLTQFRELFDRFQQILVNNNRVLELISELEDKLGGEYIFDIKFLKDTADQLSEAVYIVCSSLNVIADNRYRDLFSRQATIQEELNSILQGRPILPGGKFVIDFGDANSDMAELAGGKNSNLAEVRNRLEMRTPDGFIITTVAYSRFMDYNNLFPEIKKIHETFLGTDRDTKQYDSAIEKLFDNSRIPPDVSAAIEDYLELRNRHSSKRQRFAVRSSAFGEDSSARSFAGQFDSFLDCSEDEILSMYVRVLASRFKYSVYEYAGESIFEEDRLPMAVGVQTMIDAGNGGVVYSVDPSGEFPECLIVSAVSGSGAGVVGGEADADMYMISRLKPSEISSRRIVQKTKGADGSESDKTNDSARMSDEQVVDLADRVLMLERYFKQPVDVEWCIDHKGNLYILQCRPLKNMKKLPRRPFNRMEVLSKSPVLMKERGLVAQRGIAAGPVHQVLEDDEPTDFPIGAIAVTRYTSPRLTSIIRRASAIITDIGSPSGHMATVAREFGLPMIVNTGEATKILTNGLEVTVDAEENVVYGGIVKELLAYRAEAEDAYRDLKEYQMLRQVLRRISPLNMIDPGSAEFTAKNCRTYHDIVRFSHEKAVGILINLNISSRRFRGIETRELKLPIPLGLRVIDLGGGIDPENKGGSINSIDEIHSSPMNAVMTGLVSPGVWSTRPMQLGFGDLVSSLTRYSMADRGGTYKGQNLAVISNYYANVSLRLGYHFNVIDTYVSENVDDNYVYFRFVGGVTGTEQRHLRAILIKEILEKLNFRVTVRGDLVVARLKKLPEDKALEILQEIGRLIGFTRQLDTQMRSEQSVAESLNDFFRETSSR